MARTTGLVTYALASLFATKGPEHCGLEFGIHSPELVNEATLEYVLDVFQKHGLPLDPPRTLEELVEISEFLDGKDHNDDGEPDWGFCLTPQVNYFYSFVAPIFHDCLLVRH